MGCDIHARAEVRKDGSWITIEDPIFQGYDESSAEPFDIRSYRVFGFLADVRNYSCVHPLSQPKGWPEKETEWIRHNKEDADYHSASWFLLAELLAVDYAQEILDWRVTRGNDGAAKAESKEECEKMTLGEFLGENYSNTLEVLKTLGPPDEVRVVFAFDN